MCRLFALHADRPVTARFWLLDAPYSLRQQSHFNADGTGVGWIDGEGVATVEKRPVAAYASPRFERFAADLTSRTMIAHIRLSSGTSNTRENSHPFLQRGIITAHNGVLEVTEQMRERVRALGAADLVRGTTDTEWMSALIAGETAAHDDDLHAGLVAAISWICRHAPVYSLNLLVARGEELFALRLPDTNELWVLDREAGDGEDEALDQSSATLHATSEDLRDVHSVVIASEPMDDDEDWRLMDSGELIRVGADGAVHSEHPFPPVARQLQISDLGLSAAASQAHDAEKAQRDERRARQADKRQADKRRRAA